MNTSAPNSYSVLSILLSVLAIPLLITGVYIVREIIGIQETERVVEKVSYTSKTIYTDQLTSGTTCQKPAGKEGTIVKEYKVTKRFGKVATRELISEKVNVEPVNGINIVGTAHKYTGYCKVDGTYRKRYAQCYGDYSAESKQKAEEQARICNLSPVNETGCYNVYYSKIYNRTKNCSTVKVEDLN